MHQIPGTRTVYGLCSLRSANTLDQCSVNHLHSTRSTFARGILIAKTKFCYFPVVCFQLVLFL